MSLVATVRAEVARLDPGVAVASPRSLDRAMAESMTQRKVVLALVGVFATAALLLAAIGLYGVMAYAVATRRREFGIRMAFGAVRQDLIRQVLRGGLTPDDGGVAGGIGRRGGGRAVAGERAVSGEGQRPARHRGDRRDGARRRDPGVLGARVAGVEVSPDGGVKGGVKRDHLTITILGYVVLLSEEVAVNWSKWIRQTHRWLSIAFTLTVIANFVAMSQGQPPAWVTYSPLFPLALLLFSGLYLFVLPYAVKWRSGRHTD